MMMMMMKNIIIIIIIILYVRVCVGVSTSEKDRLTAKRSEKCSSATRCSSANAAYHSIPSWKRILMPLLQFLFTFPPVPGIHDIWPFSRGSRCGETNSDPVRYSSIPNEFPLFCSQHVHQKMGMFRSSNLSSLYSVCMVNGDAQFFCIAFQLRICKIWKAFLGSGKGFCRFLEVHTVNLVTDHHGFATLGVILFVQQHSFVSHRVEQGWLELLGVSWFSWMTCAGTKSLIVLESEDLIVPTYSATRLFFFHKEMSSLRQIAALPCFFLKQFVLIQCSSKLCT